MFLVIMVIKTLIQSVKMLEDIAMFLIMKIFNSSVITVYVNDLCDDMMSDFLNDIKIVFTQLINSYT